MEAILRAITGSVGGHFHRGGFSPEAEDPRGEERQSIQPDQVDDKYDQPSDYISTKAGLKQLQINKSSELPFPRGVDGIFDWELVEKCEPSNELDLQWTPPTEPQIQLDEDGLPADHSCNYCQHVVVRSVDLKDTQKIIIAKSRKELTRAGRDGCPLYQFLEWYLYKAEENSPSQFSEITLIFSSANDDPNSLGSMRGEFSDLRPNSRGRKGKGSFGNFSCVAAEFNPASWSIPSRPVDLDVTSHNAYIDGLTWLHSCHEDDEHPNCIPKEELFYPSRLLDVTKSSVKLIEIDEILEKYAKLKYDAVEYVALSYCWGGDQLCRTTSGIVARRKDTGIDASELPQTLRDAIKLTKDIGLDYLWIDSLCIVQDDPADVSGELSKMADIYSGAYVTISAASARSCHEGFLQRRSPSELRKLIIGLPFLRPDGRLGRFYFYRPDYHNPQEEPINERAWTLQEYLLSPRILIYGSWQLRWVCRTEQGSNGGPSGVYHQSLEKLAAKLYSDKTIPLLHERGQKALAEHRVEEAYKYLLQIDDIKELWSTIVGEFTRRKLSVPSDRAPAISGIAKQYARLSGDVYVAGLWARNIACGLLWSRPTSYIPTTQHSPRRSPSWSWLSVNGQVKWLGSAITATSPLEVVSCKTSNYGYLGKPGNFPLVVQGRIRSAFYLKTKPSTLFFFFDIDPSRGFLNTEKIVNPIANEQQKDLALTARAIFDYPINHAETEGVGVVFCLEILAFKEDTREGSSAIDYPAGILLEECEEGLRRVGYFDFEWDNGVWLTLFNGGDKDHDTRRRGMKREAFEKCPVETVTII